MQWKSVLLGAAISAGAFLTAGRVFSDDPPSDGAPSPEMMKLTQPGPEHEALKAYTGTWEGKGTYNGMTWTSHQTGRMVMGGRFLQMNEEITVPVPSGPAVVMHSLGFVGYDNLAKKYVHMNMGDDSTAFMTDEGQHDAAKKLTEMRGVEHRPGKDVKYRFTISEVVDGAFHIELFADEGAGEKQSMVGDYKKQP